MSLYLVTNGADGNLRLADGQDPAQLAKMLDQACESGDVVEVDAEMNDDPRQVIHARVNPRALGWWAVVELDDKRGTISRSF